MKHFINFRSGTQADNPWNNITTSTITEIGIRDENWDETDWSMFYVEGSEPDGSSASAGSAPTGGDALFVDQENAYGSGHRPDSTAWTQLVISGQANKELNFGFYCGSLDGRVTEIRVNNGDTQFIDNAITDDILKFTGSTDSSGDLLVEYRQHDTSSGSAYLVAAYFEEVESTDPTIIPTNPPQGGEVFSFSGSNYSAQPTGPMTFTQGTRTISRAVTISNWDAEDGSFTGVTDAALPGVPAAGASDTPALLYGEPVTISLPDPGA